MEVDIRVGTRLFEYYSGDKRMICERMAEISKVFDENVVWCATKTGKIRKGFPVYEKGCKVDGVKYVEREEWAMRLEPTHQVFKLDEKNGASLFLLRDRSGYNDMHGRADQIWVWNKDAKNGPYYKMSDAMNKYLWEVRKNG